MNVVKLAEVGRHEVRPYLFRANGTGAIATLEMRPADVVPDETTTAERRIAELELSLEEMRAQAAVEREVTLEKGRELGREEAGKRDEERLGALREALAKASAEIAVGIDEKGSLGIEIARAALGRILGERSAYPAMVVETASLWRTKLADTTVIEARVSAEDFADETALEALQKALGRIAITVDPELAAGSCIFSLSLGEVDMSIPLQAARADALLAEHALAAPAQ